MTYLSAIDVDNTWVVICGSNKKSDDVFDVSNEYTSKIINYVVKVHPLCPLECSS